jgi:hypothetical protein
MKKNRMYESNKLKSRNGYIYNVFKIHMRVFFVATIIGMCSISLSGCDTSRAAKKRRVASMRPEIYNPKDSLQVPFPIYIDTPQINDTACFGTYRGIEFIHPAFIETYGLNGTDIAHQYSNKICEYVGKHLKREFLKQNYLRVQLSKIKMKTVGMNDEDNYVEYSVYIPFQKCTRAQAMTSFDHCGGWGHRPEILKRKRDLLNSPNRIVWNRKLYVSRLYKTAEGLEEYWIQWKHKDFR